MTKKILKLILLLIKNIKCKTYQSFGIFYKNPQKLNVKQLKTSLDYEILSEVFLFILLRISLVYNSFLN